VLLDCYSVCERRRKELTLTGRALEEGLGEYRLHTAPLQATCFIRYSIITATNDTLCLHALIFCQNRLCHGICVISNL
jgi:hypothetical protein